MGDDKEKQAPKKIDLTSADAEKNLGANDPAAKASPEAKAEVVDQREKAVAGARDRALQTIKASATDLTSIKAMVDTATNMSHLQTYFDGQISRFDHDKDGKISEAEAKEYQDKMVEKTQKMIFEFKEADKKKQEVTEAASNVEKMDAEKVKSELGEIKEISDKSFESSMKEFEKMQNQNTAFQQQVSTKIDEIAAFGKSVGEFNKKRVGFNSFVHAAKEFRDLFSSGPSEDTRELNEMQAKLDGMKASANEALATLKTKKTTLENNGKIIQAAVEAERNRLIKERDDKVAEVEAAQQDQAEKLKERKEQYQKLDERKKQLEKRKGQLEEKQSVTADAQAKWEKQSQNEKLDVRKQDYTASANDALMEIQALEMMTQDPAVGPEGKAELEKAIEKVKERYRRTQAGIEMIDQRGEKEKKVKEEFKDQKESALKEINSTSAVLNGQLSPAIESLDKTISNMEILQLQYATSAVEVKDFYNKEVEKKDKLTDAVTDYLLTSSISRNKSIDSLSSAVKTLDTITLESSGFLGSLLKLPQGLLEGIGGALHDLAKWIDNNTTSALRDARDQNNGFLEFFVEGLSFFSGFLSGGLECIGGVFNLAAHPIEGLKGLSALIGFDAKNGRFSGDTFVDAWKNMCKAIIGYEDWEKGNHGQALGKLTFNVLSMFVGAGEAGAVGKAATAAKVAKIAAIDAAKLAGKEIGIMTGRGAALMAFAKSMGSSAVTAIKPKFGGNAQAAAAGASGFLGKTGAVVKSIAGSAYEGVKAGINYFRKQPMEFTKDVGGKIITETKDARPFLVDMANGAKTVGKIYGTLMLSPWLVLKGFGNGLKGLVKLGKGTSEAGLLTHFKSGKAMEAARIIETEGANFSKAQTKIAELIEHDPELAELAKTGPEGRAMAEGKAAIQLLDTQPELATSYAKVREATETLDSFNQYMAKEASKSVTKTLKDPDLKYTHDEFNRLETNRDLALADQKTTASKLGPETASFYDSPPAKILDTDKASRIKNHVESTGGHNGWSTGQKAFMEDYMLRSPELNSAPLGTKSAGNKFTKEMQVITDEFGAGKRAVPEMSEVEAFRGAKNDVKAANAELNRFTSRPSNMDKVQKYTEAKTKTAHLDDLIDQQKKLYESHAQPGPELVAMEAEVGEARAMAGELGPNGEYPRPSIKDDPVFMEGAHDRFVDAVKSGDAKAIESAKGDFGIYSKKTGMGKSLDAIERATLESPVAKADRLQAINDFEVACSANPDVAAVRDRFTAALRDGNLTELDKIRKEVQASPGGYRSAAVPGPDIIKGLDALEMEYRANPANLIETYR
ncbi:hypothetical protein IT411_00740, partial [Candidatus Peregrinibacteria bacterium]|nr:hypothetical protein [Candidatus Peregrinibacteria bacterium]